MGVTGNRSGDDGGPVLYGAGAVELRFPLIFVFP